VDTEKDLENAIEAAPELLFGAAYTPARFVQLARQHHICTENQARHVVDLVFVDQTENELILVELKRGKLTPAHEQQLQRYLDHAHESHLLRAVLDSGAGMRGILATVETAGRPFRPQNRSITAHVIDRQEASDVLVQMRRRATTDNPVAL
jgi:RecB family endonuclease NucS